MAIGTRNVLDDTQHLDDVPDIPDDEIELNTPATPTKVIPDRDPATYLRVPIHQANDTLLRLVTEINGVKIFKNTSTDGEISGGESYVAFCANDGKGFYVYREAYAWDYFKTTLSGQLEHCIARLKTLDREKNLQGYNAQELYGVVHHERCLNNEGKPLPSAKRVQAFITGDYAHNLYYFASVKTSTPKEKAPATSNGNIQQPKQVEEPKQASENAAKQVGTPARESTEPVYFILSEFNSKDSKPIFFKLDKEVTPEFENKIIREFVSTYPVQVGGEKVKLRAYMDSKRHSIRIYKDGCDNFYNAIKEQQMVNLVTDIYMNKSERAYYMSGMLNGKKMGGKFGGPIKDLLLQILKDNCQIYLNKKLQKEQGHTPESDNFSQYQP